MKALAYLAAAVLASAAMVAQAQTSAPSSGNRVVIPVPPAPPLDYPYGYYGSSTVAEGYARGVADVIRARGDYNLSTSAAAVNLTEARRQDLENRKQATQTYFDIRDINRRAFEAEQGRRRGDPAAWSRYAQIGKPKRLASSELDNVTGVIRWPLLLTAQAYRAQRIEMERAFADRAYRGVMQAEAFLTVSRLTDDLLADLKSQVRALPVEQYVTAKRFLESLVYEAAQPTG